MSDEKPKDSLFGLRAWNGEWKSTPLTAEKLREGFREMWEAYERQRANPQPHIMYGTQADVNAMAEDFASDPAFNNSVRITRGADGNVTSIEW